MTFQTKFATDQLPTAQETVSPAAYLDVLGLLERLHRLLLDLIKDEFERLRLDEINPVQALLLYNIGSHEVSVGELKSRGYYQDRRSVRVRLTEKGLHARGVVATLFASHADEFSDREDALREDVDTVSETLRSLERFWSEQIRYIY